jgi:hypothetical protein
MAAKSRNTRVTLAEGLAEPSPGLATNSQVDQEEANPQAQKKDGKKSALEGVHNLPPPEKEELKAQAPLPKWRRIMVIIVEHWAFDGIISLFTLVFAAVLASNDINTALYPERNVDLIKAYTSCQLIVVIFFTLEGIFKLSAFGLRSRKAKSADELESIFEHDPNSARKLLTEQQVGEITDTFNLFDIAKTGTINRRDLRAASRALGLAVEIGSEEEALLQRPGPDLLDVNDFICAMSLVLTRGSELHGYFASTWNWLYPLNSFVVHNFTFFPIFLHAFLY